MAAREPAQQPAAEASASAQPQQPGSSTQENHPQSQAQDLTGTVAKHYNQLQEAGREERKDSRIFYLRNFNNWVKSMAIGDILTRVRQDRGSEKSITVLDLCCGKGGDLLKWKKGQIDRLVCADIAATSVEQCEVRYNENVERGKRDRYPQKMFTAEFIAADCTKERLKDKYKSPSPEFDLVSCQFSFHYCFESLRQAEMMLRNACECLAPGGYFIGTTPDSYELVKRLRASDDMSFGNDVYRVTFRTEDKENMPLFGAKYDFHLEGVVDCPEFLVYFPLLEKMAEKFNMKLIKRTPFAQYFEEQITSRDGRTLIGKMQGLESFPPDNGVELTGGDEAGYSHAKKLQEAAAKERSQQDSHDRPGRQPKVGTLSQAEWEASTIYLVFVFQKMTDAEVAAKTAKRPAEEDADEEEEAASSSKQLKTS